jgi:hypothetical protein
LRGRLRPTADLRRLVEDLPRARRRLQRRVARPLSQIRHELLVKGVEAGRRRGGLQVVDGRGWPV